jgi:hypothetical protein
MRDHPGEQPGRRPAEQSDLAAAGLAADPAGLDPERELEATHSINQRIFETSLDLILVVDRQEPKARRGDPRRARRHGLMRRG